MMAIVAGSTPLSLRISYTYMAHFLLLGYGMPWEMIVDSRETTGLRYWIALATKGEIFRRSL